MQRAIKLQPYLYTDRGTNERYLDIPFLRPVSFVDTRECYEDEEDDRQTLNDNSLRMRTPVVQNEHEGAGCTAIRLHASSVFQRGLVCFFQPDAHRKLGMRLREHAEMTSTTQEMRRLKQVNWRRIQPTESPSNAQRFAGDDDYPMYLPNGQTQIAELFEALETLPMACTIPRGCLVRAVSDDVLKEHSTTAANEGKVLRYFRQHGISLKDIHEDPSQMSYVELLDRLLVNNHADTRTINITASAHVQGHRLLKSILDDASVELQHDIVSNSTYDENVRDKLVSIMMYIEFYDARAYSYLINTKCLRMDTNAWLPASPSDMSSDRSLARSAELFTMDTDHLQQVFYLRQDNAITDIMNDNDLTFLSGVKVASATDLMTLFDQHRLLLVAPDDGDARAITYDDVRVRKGAASKRTPGSIVNTNVHAIDTQRTCWVSQGIELFVTAMEEEFNKFVTSLTAIDEAVLYRVRATPIHSSKIKKALLSSRLRNAVAATVEYYRRMDTDSSTLQELCAESDARVVAGSNAHHKPDDRERRSMVFEFAKDYHEALKKLRMHDLHLLKDCCSVSSTDGDDPHLKKIDSKHVPVLRNLLRYATTDTFIFDSPYPDVVETQSQVSDRLQTSIIHVLHDAKNFVTWVETTSASSDREIQELYEFLRDEAVVWLRRIAVEYGQLGDDTSAEVARDSSDDATALFWLRYMRDAERRKRAYDAWREEWSGGFTGFACVNGRMFRHPPSIPKAEQLRDLTHVELWSVVALELQLCLARHSLRMMHRGSACETSK
ncbi:hypothetical protein CYMTET_2579 [Cymbomonas tetramitiformis]|uniref:Uncharacterized protein n=1 Tax=Cymbomonas tetramitiformis TaxID=36881 RepID=A0AAE0H508_9CHLO|nr:hypothetical protein CYMTET_39624 [Cymbomonas tetramitiformis]KAK3289976.1 hypothetical protein CYMTET_2579 [Cymbomonas tetramitiformis]